MKYFATLLVLLSLGLFTVATVGCGDGVDPVTPTPNDEPETPVGTEDPAPPVDEEPLN